MGTKKWKTPKTSLGHKTKFWPFKNQKKKIKNWGIFDIRQKFSLFKQEKKIKKKNLFNIQFSKVQNFLILLKLIENAQKSPKRSTTIFLTDPV